MKPVNSLCFLFICMLMLLPGTIYSETKRPKNIFNTQEGDLKIESVSWELDINKSMIIFDRDVKIEGLKVEGDDITMSCQKLELYFKKRGKGTSIQSNDIEKIIASESIVIKRSDGSYATAENAEYIMGSEKIFLTGNPYFTNGKGIEGRALKITIDMKEGTYSAEGTKEDKATLSRAGKGER